MRAMSDRAITRSLRTMEGFGVNTFRVVKREGMWKFVKFHCWPILETSARLATPRFVEPHFVMECAG